MLSEQKKPAIFGFSLGFYSTLGQVVLLREALTLFGGNELSVALSLTIWLAGVGIGAVVATRIKNPVFYLTASPVVVFVLFLLGLLVLRMHHLIISIPQGMQMPLWQLLLFLAVGVGGGATTVGFLFTLAARAMSTVSSSADKIYFAEALGALAAGTLFTFVFAGRVNHTQIIAIGVAALCPGAMIFMRRRAQIVCLGGLAVLSAAIFQEPLFAADRLSMELEFKSHAARGEPLGFEDSHYGRLSLGEREGQYQLYWDGRLRYAFPDPWERNKIVHAALLQHPNPQKVLLLGGGAPNRLYAALAHSPKSVTLTYLDADVLKLCRPYFNAQTNNALKDARTHLTPKDGQSFLLETKERFDVVIVFAAPPLSARDNRYQTLEFFEAVQKVLAPGGSMTLRAPGGANLLSAEASRSAAVTLRTLKKVFVHVVPAAGIETTFHAASKDGVITGQLNKLSKRFDKRNISDVTFVFSSLIEMYKSVRIKSLMSQLEKWNEKETSINTDLNPRAYLTNLQLWERGLWGKKANTSTWSGIFERTAWIWPAIFALIWLGAATFIRRSKEHRFWTLFSMATTGAAGMSAQVMTMYVYQASSGVLYTSLAFLVSMFMAGLAVGAYAGRRLSYANKQTNGAIWDLLVLALLAATGPVLSCVFEHSYLAFIWSAAAGFATGAAFTSALGELEKIMKKISAAAGPIEAADHLGASTGALVTGLIWLPIYGLYRTCFLFAALKGLSVGGRLLFALRHKN